MVSKNNANILLIQLHSNLTGLESDLVLVILQPTESFSLSAISNTRDQRKMKATMGEKRR